MFSYKFESQEVERNQVSSIKNLVHNLPHDFPNKRRFRKK